MVRLQSILHRYGISQMIDIKQLKREIENKIKEKALERPYYIPFDKKNSQPWVFHLFYKDGKFMMKF